MATKPQLLLVMRHAEKPDDPKDPDLSGAGHERAKKLATYIPETFGKPDNILAAAISKHSARPYETVRPLAKAVGIPIDATIADQDYGTLADDLLSDPQYDGKKIVVCWHHGNIPSLMHALGAPAGSFPEPWDRNVFNLILKVEFDAEGAMKITKMIEGF